MPYTEKTAEYWRDKKRHQRMSKNDVQETNVQENKGEMSKKTRPNRLGPNGLPEMVENEYNPNETLPDGTMRYLGPFSDGQCLDRTTVNAIK